MSNPLLETAAVKEVQQSTVPENATKDPMGHILADKPAVPTQGMMFPDYMLAVHPKAMEVPEIKAIVDKKIPVEEMTQEDLRVVYHFITGNPMKKVYSASAVNHIAKNGKFPEYKDLPESDSLFIGDQVHKAMEVRGKNLNKLKILDDLGPVPEAPATPDLTADNIKILKQLALGMNRVQAYCAVKSNKTIDDVDSAELDKYNNDQFSEEEEPSKALTKLIKAAEKECDKVDAFIPQYRDYLEKLGTYEKRREEMRTKDYVILDDIPYRKMGAERMRNTITRTYEALRDSDEVMSYYWNGYHSKIDGADIRAYTEFVVLWRYYLNEKEYVPCKSMFDKLHLDFTNKNAIVQDIKTHSKKGRQFVTNNYFEYSYFRSMAFYVEAIRQYLKQQGENPDEWKIYAILLPVSTTTYEVGCFNPVVVISQTDLDMGTNGGYMKPIGTKFNEEGFAQWALDAEQFKKYASIGIIHQNAYEYYIKGWKQLIQECEMKSKVVRNV